MKYEDRFLTIIPVTNQKKVLILLITNQKKIYLMPTECCPDPLSSCRCISIINLGPIMAEADTLKTNV